MPGDSGKIQCAFCSRELDDTHEPMIHCKFCGKHFRRIDIFNEDEKMLRQTLIIDLSTHMSKLKITKNIAFLMGFLCLGAAVALLFAEEFPMYMWLIVGAFALGTAGWWTIGGITSAKYVANQSKLFDLSGGRRVD